ncbi:Yip1 member 7 [Ascosphaera pollenicola]|nr:Yip1 member 7 [Ascosphaera pollenicola]
MATKAAYKRLTREYQNIQKSPPPYIEAHPSESNILEWHYVITGPPDTPYENGQYWGTLVFPQDYPFAPPAIRMHTPSGRFQPSTRLCLSISDFHPRSFNPAWEVSTILIGLLSFMTSEEMTTGSVSASAAERRIFAARSRWWNSTGGGSSTKATPGVTPSTRGLGNVKAGDGGLKFRSEWPEHDKQNWKWMEDNHIDAATGLAVPTSDAPAPSSCSPEGSALRKRLSTSTSGLNAVVDRGQAARDAGESWFKRNRLWIGLAVIFGYAILVRIYDVSEGLSSSSRS